MAPSTLAAPPVRPGTAPTEAEQLARRNRAANAAAFERCRVDLPAPAADLTWVFGRDGSLTAFEAGEGERWITGCSVPRLAARAMLETLAPAEGAACFLNPEHAAQVRVALEKLGPSQALICIVPDAVTFAAVLHCEDFSPDLAAGRLWFAWGDNWADDLAWLFVDAPGLPSPARFVRLPQSDEAVVNQLISGAQAVFASVAKTRSAKVDAARQSWRPRPSGLRPREVCVIARSRFRLWDDAGDALYAALTSGPSSGGTTWTRFDPDAPAGSSPLALAAAAAAADAVIAADVSRADAPGLVHPDQAWVNWLTTPHIPAARSAGPNDRLVVADPAWRDAAIRAGWAEAAVSVASWPRLDVAELHCPDVAPGGRFLAIIADTSSLEAPKSLSDYSSHTLLWDKLRRAIARDPLAVPADVEGWLLDHARVDGIAVETLDVRLFVLSLIVPAYQHALAGALAAAGLPVRLYGTGWSELPRLRDHVGADAIASRSDLADAAGASAAVVHVWPGGAIHPIDGLRRPVVRPVGQRLESFVRSARLAAAGAHEPAARPNVAPISSAMLDIV